MATIKYLLQSKSETAGIYIRLRDGRAIDVKAPSHYFINANDWNPNKGEPKNLKDASGKSLQSDLGLLKATLLKYYNDTSDRSIVTNLWLKNFLAEYHGLTPPEPDQKKPETTLVPAPIALPTESIKHPINTQTVNNTVSIIQPVPYNASTINSLALNHQNPPPVRLIDYIEFYISVKNNDITKQTTTKLRVIKHFLENFEIYVNKGLQEISPNACFRSITIKDVNEDFRSLFIKFSIENSYAQNTYAKNFKYIKTICYHAGSRGIPVSPDLKSLTIKNQKVKHIHLSFDQLDILERTKYNDEALDNARDWLLISCDTGQRVSDFLKFDSKMLRIEKGHFLIEFTQQKTKQVMAIPISDRVKKILRKRKGQFPRKLSDQRYNEHIKKVCDYAGFSDLVEGGLQDPETKKKIIAVYPFWKLVSSHIGRRSFATNYYGIIPTPLLMVMTGHTTEKAFLVYIGKSDTQQAVVLANELKKADNARNIKKQKRSKKSMAA
jgi:integrase